MVKESGNCPWVAVIADIVFGCLAAIAWSELTGQSALTWSWLGPGVVIVGWATIRNPMGRRRAGWRRELVVGVGGVTVGSLLPAWPGASSPLEQANVIALALLAAYAWRGVVRLAESPAPGAGERARVLLLVTVLLVTWWVYFTPQIVGVVDERWYGDLMTDFLGQVRAGVFPVFGGQGEYAWNGNVHPFRSAPWHHYFGAGLDLLTLRKLTPLAVQHLVLVASEFTAVLVLYVGLRRLRPLQPWFAWLIAFLFATCPAVTMAQIQHDMYMTSGALPVVVFIVLALSFALERDTWRAWSWLGAGLGAVWFCHPPVALLTSGAVAIVLVFRFVADPIKPPTLARVATAGVICGATCIGYFVSMQEISPLRNGFGDPLAHVVVPGLAIGAIVVGLAGLNRLTTLVSLGISAGAVVIGVEALGFFSRAAVVPAVVFVVCGLGWCWGHRRLGLGRFPEMMIIVPALAVGLWFGPRLSGDGTIDAWLTAAGSGYKHLWLPLHFGGKDQLGFAVWLGLGLAAVGIFRASQPVGRALFMGVLVLTLALAPIPGVARFFWQNAPREIVDVVSVAYFLRFLPVTAPFCVVVVFLGLTGKATSKAGRIAVFACSLFVPWVTWEHALVITRAWQFRHPAGLTRDYLRSENRPLSRFHYDLEPYSPYHNHGVADYRIETRLWFLEKGPDNRIGPDEYAESGARALAADWIDATVTQDPVYPAWLYLSPPVTLAPGQRRLITFDWQGRVVQGWLIFRSRHIYRDYHLPEAGGSHGFGTFGLNHHTLSIWNSGKETEEVELVIKREGAGAEQPHKKGEPLVRFRVTDYDPAAVPVEVLGLQPLQLRITAGQAAYVETFRVWLPGYRVNVDAKPVRYFRSPNGLVGFFIPAGTHIADVRFRGTPQLRVAANWSLFVGGVLFVALIGECVRLARRPNRPLPA